MLTHSHTHASTRFDTRRQPAVGGRCDAYHRHHDSRQQTLSIRSESVDASNAKIMREHCAPMTGVEQVEYIHVHPFVCVSRTNIKRECAGNVHTI